MSLVLYIATQVPCHSIYTHERCLSRCLYTGSMVCKSHCPPPEILLTHRSHFPNIKPTAACGSEVVAAAYVNYLRICPLCPIHQLILTPQQLKLSPSKLITDYVHVLYYYLGLSRTLLLLPLCFLTEILGLLWFPAPHPASDALSSLAVGQGPQVPLFPLPLLPQTRLPGLNSHCIVQSESNRVLKTGKREN